MFRFLVYEVRWRVTTLRRRLVMYRLLGSHDDLAFFAMLSLPFGILGLIVYFSMTLRDDAEELRRVAAEQREKDLICLAENIYFEGRGEPIQGQIAIAEVTMNRLASPLFPDSVCDVVHDARWDAKRRRLTAHFSWTEFKWRREPTGPAWKQSMAVATSVYDKVYMPVVPNALFYHATSIRPYWADSKRVVATIGGHVFYK